MGGIVTRAAKQLHSAKIARSAYIASPHNGAVNAYLALHPAIQLPFFGAYLDQIADLGLRAILGAVGPLAKLHKQVATWKSVYDLLPDDRYLLPNRHPMVTIKAAVGQNTPLFTPPTIYFNNQHSSFPQQMRGEVQRALAFKGSLAPVPPEKHIIFYCNLRKTEDQINWYRFRQPYKSLPGASNLIWPGFEDPYDSGQKGDGTVPSDSANPTGATRVVPVNGQHMWIPSMSIVHLALRNFLAGP